jgi:cystathionine gamma-synthase
MRVPQVRDLHGTLGGTLDSRAAYLVLRGMKTLGVRVQFQNKSALALAQYLESQPVPC